MWSSYHMSCFTCSACSTAFDDVYWEHEGKALCEKHYLQVKNDPSLSLCVPWYTMAVASLSFDARRRPERSASSVRS